VQELGFYFALMPIGIGTGRFGPQCHGIRGVLQGDTIHFASSIDPQTAYGRQDLSNKAILDYRGQTVRHFDRYKQVFHLRRRGSGARLLSGCGNMMVQPTESGPQRCG